MISRLERDFSHPRGMEISSDRFVPHLRAGRLIPGQQVKCPAALLGSKPVADGMSSYDRSLITIDKPRGITELQTPGISHRERGPDPARRPHRGSRSGDAPNSDGLRAKGNGIKNGSLR